MDMMALRRAIMFGNWELPKYDILANPAVFETDIIRPFKKCKFVLSPHQKGTGDPSPSNIRQIQSFTKVGVRLTGKNLFDKSTPITRGQHIAETGEYQAVNTRIMTDYIPVREGTTYTFNVPSNNSPGLSFTNYNLFDENKQWLGSRIQNGEPSAFTGAYYHSFTPTINGSAYVRLVLRDKDNSATSIASKTLQNANLQLEIGGAKTSYEAYAGEEFSYDPDVGFCGGTLDLLTGKFTIEWVGTQIKENQWDKIAHPDSRISVFRIASYQPLKNRLSVPLCNCFPVYLNSQGGPDISSLSEGDIWIQVSNTNVSDAEYIDFYIKTANLYASDFRYLINGLSYDPYICYKLITPQVYQITPETILPHLGVNVLSSYVNGDFDITYSKRT